MSITNAIPAIALSFLFILALGGSIFTLVFFRHEDDKKGSWGAKIVVVIGLFSSLMGIFMLPLDVLNRANNGTVPMGMFWMVFCMFIVLQVLFLIPFMIAWYDFEATTFGQRLCKALKFEFWVIFVFSIITGVCFYFYGFANVPYTTLNNQFLDELPAGQILPFIAETSICPDFLCIIGTKLKFPIRVSFPVYMVALVALIGWFFLVVFGGIGLISLPIDLVFAYKSRPMKIELEQFAKIRLDMRERAQKLLEFGKTLEAETSGRVMTARQLKMFNKFKQSSIRANDDWEKAKKMYSGEGIGILIPILQLATGVLGGFVSFFWILHMVLYGVPNAVRGRPLNPFLNGAFVGGERYFPIITLVLYTIFTFWMLWAVIRGFTKIGLRVVTVPVHPLKKNGTYMNSMLVNTSLVVCTSIAVITYTSYQLDLYLRLTAADMIFNVMLKNLKGLEPAWIVYQILFFIIVLVTSIYFILFPKDVNREEELQKDLDEIMNPAKRQSSRCTIL